MIAEDGVLPAQTLSGERAGTLPGLFGQRVAATPDGLAYRQWEGGAWQDYCWARVAGLVSRWQAALAGEDLRPGDRVAIGLRNGVDWVCCDQAALGLGLVPVPLYTTDSPGNMAYILADCGARLLVLESDQAWGALGMGPGGLPDLRRVLCRGRGTGDPAAGPGDPRVRSLADWLPAAGPGLQDRTRDPDALATIVYTSGTTGRPKGVMQSHRAILWTAEAVLRRIPAWPADRFLSFLPLAHSFERTVGYYLAMMAGSGTVYARSVESLGDDLAGQRPTVLLAVPRVYEKVYLALQRGLGPGGAKRRLFEAAVDLGWRRFLARQGRGPALSPWETGAAALLRALVARRVLARLGGRLRVAVSGGAPLSPAVARLFIGLGLPLTEGYGLTEASPVLTNSRPEDCVPGAVGRPLPGLELAIGPQGEVLARTPGAMLGYWGQPGASAQAIDGEGWLHTGDQGELREGYLWIRGRLKEILVTSNGEKVAPAELEQALTLDPLIAQALILGEGRPYLAALLVLEPGAWELLARGLGLDPQDPGALTHESALGAVLERVQDQLRDFPGCARVRAVHLTLTPWTLGEGLMTPTLKVRRGPVAARFADAIHRLYGRHEVPWGLP